MSKTGTKEWAETTINIARGCEHQCRYCYARHMLVERFNLITPQAWKKTTPFIKSIDKRYGKFMGTVMMPSTHDVTPAIINEFCCVLRKLLDAGNDVLIVTKPHLECIQLICLAFAEHREKILFRFTIGSTSSDVLKFWEPGAPDFIERLASLKYAFDHGFKTSVSCEPYLDPYVVYTYEACRPYLTDSFWIGKLKHFNSRVKLDDATPDQIAKYVDTLKSAQSDEVVRSIYRLLSGQPYIQWKDSIQEVMEASK